MKKRAKLNNKNSKFVKSLSVAALAGLTFFGAQANAQDTDLIEVYQTAGDREYNFESADDVYTVQSSLGVMGEGSFTVNGVLADDGTKSTIDLNDKDGFKVSDIDKFSAGNLEIKNAVSTDGLGGAIQFKTSGLQELGNNLTFDNNKSQLGGAIYNATDTLNIGDNAEFKGGTSYEGGAIFTLGGTINIGNNLNVNNNHATGEVSQDGTPIQTDVNAGIGGGLFVTAGADVTIGDNAKFENNTAKHYGGAIAALDANSFKIGDNAIFKGNSAGSGSAVYAKNTNSVTIGDNTVFESNYGGNIYVFDTHTLNLVTI
jgi:predicted outer membrane repeat protein